MGGKKISIFGPFFLVSDVIRRSRDDVVRVVVLLFGGGDVDDGECDEGVDVVGRRRKREKRRRNGSAALRDDGDDDDREILCSKVTQRRPPRFLSLWRNQTSRANETIHGIDRRTHTENRAR